MKKRILKKVGISVSEPPDEDLEKNGLTIYHLRDFLIELLRFFIAKNFQIIYGGALNYSLGKINFTQVFIDLAENYYQGYSKIKSNIPLPLLVNFSAYPYCKDIVLKETELKAKFKIKNNGYLVGFRFFPEDCIGEKDNVCEYLTNMRKAMSECEDARVLAGGKLEGICGYSGVVEEAVYSIQNGKHIFLIGCFGGATREIIKLLLQKDSKISKQKIPEIEDLKEFFQSVKIDNLNSLTPEENKKLFYSTNIYEIIHLILKGLSEHHS